MGKLSMFFLFLTILMGIVMGCYGAEIYKDVNAWQARARESNDPAEIHTYMLKVQKGMESRKMTKGNGATIFTSAENDMALVYKSVKQQVAQADELANMEKDTPQYQTGLLNLKDSVGKLTLHTWGYWCANDGLAANILIWTFGILFLLCVLGWFVEIS